MLGQAKNPQLSVGQLAPGFQPLALLLILNEDVVKSRAGRGMDFCSLPLWKCSAKPEPPAGAASEAAAARASAGGSWGGRAQPARGEDAEAPTPSAYLMLKPVVWSSLSQLCSFASSL